MGLSKQQLAMVVVLIAGAFLTMLNLTLLTPALATIMDHLNVGTTTVQWLTSAYALTEALVMPLNAYFLGRFSSRKLFVGSVVLFAAASLACALAPSFGFLLGGRIVQAMATGTLLPMVFTLLMLIFPRERRGTAMGLVGLVVSFAPTLAPTISGMLVEHVGWRALFGVDAVVACVIAVAAVVCLKDFKGFEKTTFDAPSLLLLAVGMLSLLYGLATVSSSGNPAMSVALMAVGVVVIGLFARRQLKLDVPLLHIDVFKHREFATAMFIIMFMEAALIGAGVIVPLFIQNALGDSPTVSGLLMLPGAAGGAALGFVAGAAFDRLGARRVALPGSFLLLLGATGCAALGPDATNLQICLAYSAIACGLQALITPINTWGINALPNVSISHGNAIASTMEQVGSSLGTAFVMSLTALSFLIAPEGSNEALVSYAGCHIAFLGLAAITAVIFLCIMLFVKGTPKPPAQPAGESRGETAGDAAQAIAQAPLRVADLMNPSPAFLTTEKTVGDAVRAMRDKDTSGLPIVFNDGSVVGFVSDGDIIKRLARHENSRGEDDSYLIILHTETLAEKTKRTLAAPVMEVATKRVIAVDAEDNADRAFKVLSERRIKKVPVLRDGVLVGTLSRANVMKAIDMPEGVD